MSRDINRLTQLPCRGMIQATGSYAVHHRRCSTGACGASSARQTVATLCAPLPDAIRACCACTSKARSPRAWSRLTTFGDGARSPVGR